MRENEWLRERKKQRHQREVHPSATPLCSTIIGKHGSVEV